MRTWEPNLPDPKTVGVGDTEVCEEAISPESSTLGLKEATKSSPLLLQASDMHMP